MNTWTTRLRERMQSLGLTQEELAQRLGITRAAIAHYLAERRAPSLKQFNKLAHVLHCDPAWLQFGITAKIPENHSNELTSHWTRRVPLLSWRQISESSVIEDYINDKTTWVPGVCQQEEKSRWFALCLHGDAMTAPSGQTLSFLANDILIVDPDKTPQHGDFVIAMLPESSEATFKQYVVDAGKSYLKPLNPQYPIQPFTPEISIAGIVISRLTMLK